MHKWLASQSCGDQARLSVKPLTRRERRSHAKTGGQMRELLQSVGDAAQMRLRYSSFSLHLMKGKIDEPSRALRYSNAQAHNTKVPGDVAHRTHCVRTTQPPLLTNFLFCTDNCCFIKIYDDRKCDKDLARAPHFQSEIFY